jgi:hypothetical protein
MVVVGLVVRRWWRVSLDIRLPRTLLFLPIGCWAPERQKSAAGVSKYP